MFTSVNESFEGLRRAVSAWRSEEAGDLVAEAGVVSVLHYGHHLDLKDVFYLNVLLYLSK